jgi:squalene cyclase
VSTEEAESSPTAPASLVHGTHIMQLWRSAFHPIMENVEFVYPDSATTTFFQIISN